MSPFSKLFNIMIFSEWVKFLKSIKNLPPLICLYCPNLLSNGSLCKCDVRTYLHPSSNNSSIRAAWHKSVLISAELVCFVAVNVSKHGIFSFFHLATHAANDLKNSGFMSPIFIALPRRLFGRDCFFEFEIIHQMFKSFRRSALLFFSGKYNSIAAVVVSWTMAYANGTLWLLLPGWSTFKFNLGALRKFTRSVQSFS